MLKFRNSDLKTSANECGYRGSIAEKRYFDVCSVVRILSKAGSIAARTAFFHQTTVIAAQAISR
jgi:hypothetical protein